MLPGVRRGSFSSDQTGPGPAVFPAFRQSPPAGPGRKVGSDGRDRSNFPMVLSGPGAASGTALFGHVSQTCQRRHHRPRDARLQSNRNGHSRWSLGMRREGPGAFSISALAPASAPKCSASFAGQSKADESLAPGGGFRGGGGDGGSVGNHITATSQRKGGGLGPDFACSCCTVWLGCRFGCNGACPESQPSLPLTSRHRRRHP